MTLAEFRRMVEEARTAHPQWFALPPDESPSAEDVTAHLSELRVQMPNQYLDFLHEYGGGDFAFLVVYSMDRESDLNVVVQNAVPWLDRSDFVAVSDNGAGDFYGFEVRDGVCSTAVMLLDHETGELRQSGEADWFDFVVTKGLEQ